MNIGWGREENEGKLIIIDGTIEVCTFEEALRKFPKQKETIIDFVKTTSVKEYERVAFENPELLKLEVGLEETSKVAAKWWADKLRYGTVQNNGEDMQSLMMTILSMRGSKRNEEDIQRFEDVLAELIDQQLAMRGGAYLRVDYHPEGLLRDAAEEANIDVSFALPVKTSMRVDSGTIMVAEGYGAEEKQLYPKVDRNKKK